MAQQEEVSRKQLPFEFMLNGLRLKDGIELARYTERTGLPLSSIHAPIDEAVAKGWLQRDGLWVRPTVRGYDLLNDVLGLFLPAN